jgi:hypothetical protein
MNIDGASLAQSAAPTTIVPVDGFEPGRFPDGQHFVFEYLSNLSRDLPTCGTVADALATGREVDLFLSEEQGIRLAMRIRYDRDEPCPDTLRSAPTPTEKEGLS